MLLLIFYINNLYFFELRVSMKQSVTQIHE